MSKSKRIFLIIALVFLAIVLYMAYDISQRTTAPWNKHKTEKPEQNKVEETH